jgi:hypothetical protein
VELSLGAGSAARAQFGERKEETTMNLSPYHLIAHEIGTDTVVLDWPNVVPTRRFQRGDVISEGDAQWQVVGVRNTSTEQLWLIDVKKVVKV